MIEKESGKAGALLVGLMSLSACVGPKTGESENLDLSDMNLPARESSEFPRENSRAALYNPEKVAELEESIAKTRRRLAPEILSLGLAVTRAQLMDNVLDSKYGSIEAPKLQLRDDYEFLYDPASECELTNPVHSKVLNAAVQELHLRTQLVLVDLALFRHGMAIEDEFSSLLEEVEDLRSNPALKGSYVLRAGNEALVLNTSENLFSFMTRIAEGMIELYGAQISPFDIYESQRLLNELKELAPEYLELATEADVQARTQPALAALFGEDTELPRLVFHTNREEFEASFRDPKQAKKAEAFHSDIRDRIEVYAKPLWDLVLDLGHEYGHPAQFHSRLELEDRSRELSERLELLKAHRGTVKRAEDLLERIYELPPEAPLPQGIVEETRALNRSLELGSLKIMLSNLDELQEQNHFEQYGAHHNAVEEVSAALFQRVFLAELEAERPAVARLLIQLADFSNRASGGTVHYGAFRYAEQMAAEDFANDWAEAYRVICEPKDEATYNDIEARAAELASADGFSANPNAKLLKKIELVPMMTELASEVEARRLEFAELKLEDSEVVADFELRLRLRIAADVRAAREAFEVLLRELYK